MTNLLKTLEAESEVASQQDSNLQTHGVEIVTQGILVVPTTD
jgi:hypothetical protein